MQQGQADILIARFPDPNYGVKTVNFIITPLTYRELSVSSSLRHLEVSLSFTLVSPTQVSITPKRKEFSMDFKNKVKGNIWGQIPLSKHKGLRGILGSTEKKHLFQILITPMRPGFSEGHENNTHFMKR